MTSLRGGRPRLSEVPGAHEAARDGHRPREHRPLPRRGGRGDRGKAPLPEPRPAVLEEPRPSPAGARRGGRMSQRRERRAAVGAGRESGAGRGVERSARCAGSARRSAPPVRSSDVPATCRGAIGVAKRRGRRLRDGREDGVDGRIGLVQPPTLPPEADDSSLPRSTTASGGRLPERTGRLNIHSVGGILATLIITPGVRHHCPEERPARE